MSLGEPDRHTRRRFCGHKMIGVSALMAAFGFQALLMLFCFFVEQPGLRHGRIEIELPGFLNRF